MPWPALRLCLLPIAFVAAMALAACGAEPEPRGPTVLAAASTQRAMEDAADAWAAKGHLRPVLSFAGTGALARQVGLGAPADVFISADERWMDWLEQQVSLKPGTRAIIATNRLVLIAPKDSRVTFPAKGGWAAALDGGRLAIADPDTVPAGRYGKAALIATGAWDAVQEHAVETGDVRAALLLVTRGDARLGVVYASDAAMEPDVRVVGTFDADSHAPIRYPAAIPARSRNPGAAPFLAFLRSAEGQAILARHGFGPPDTAAN